MRIKEVSARARNDGQSITSTSAGWTNTLTTTSTSLDGNLTDGNLTIKTALVYVDGAGDMEFRI